MYLDQSLASTHKIMFVYQVRPVHPVNSYSSVLKLWTLNSKNYNRMEFVVLLL